MHRQLIMHRPRHAKLSRKEFAKLRKEPAPVKPIEGVVWGAAVAHEIHIGKILSAAEHDTRSAEQDFLGVVPHGFEPMNLVLSDFSRWSWTWTCKESGAASNFSGESYVAPKAVETSIRRMNRLYIIHGKREVLFCRWVPADGDREFLVFIFYFGAIVAWDMPTTHRKMLINFIRPGFVNAYIDRTADTKFVHPDSFHEENLYYEEEEIMFLIPSQYRDKVRLLALSDDGCSLDDHHMTDEAGEVDSDNASLYGQRRKQSGSRDHVTSVPKPWIHADVIYLAEDFNIFERAAYAYAMAQSIKLSVFEDNIDHAIITTRQIPDGIKKTGRITTNRVYVRQCIGALFTTRFHVNLHSDILDTPELFWEYDIWESHYSCCRIYLDIPKRVNVINTRLNVIRDMYDMLNSEILAENGIKLEWIVIYLVLAEVLIDVVWNIFIRDVLKWV